MADEIRVDGLTFECIIGIEPVEREVPQPVRVDLRLGLDLRQAGRSGRIGDTVDYDRICREVVALVRFRQFRLIEAAAEEIAAMLLGVHPKLHQVRVQLHKPRALARFDAVASTTLLRTRQHTPARHETTRFGEVDVLLETKEAGLYLLHVAPGHSIPPHRHEVMRELEWLVEGELWQGERRVPLIEPRAWPHGQVHSYTNRSTERATLFCCDCPPFIPADEIEVGA